MGWRSKDEKTRPAGDAIENVVGRSAFIRGELSAEGAFRIDGTIEGTVASRAEVVIGETGVVKGDVVGSDVVVAGQVLGNVRCTGHLEILAKGKVEGDIAAQSVRIETGGVFRGTSFMGPSGGGPKHKVIEPDSDAELDPDTGHLVAAT
ncbi:MAG TPA: polymer-forming cytoskeletal protein [Polyangia bacterium]|jgi:cytoskeletal protein CcmA (bactofilin family)|nr:polymer-forming cytoskeletal protein [Polyangia bacterium]